MLRLLGQLEYQEKFGNKDFKKTKEYSETSKVGRRGLLFQSSRTWTRRLVIVSLVVEVPERRLPAGKVDQVLSAERHLQLLSTTSSLCRLGSSFQAEVNKFTVEIWLLFWLSVEVVAAVHLAVQNKFLVEASSSSSC